MQESTVLLESLPWSSNTEESARKAIDSIREKGRKDRVKMSVRLCLYLKKTFSFEVACTFVDEFLKVEKTSGEMMKEIVVENETTEMKKIKSILKESNLIESQIEGDSLECG